jgi:hypothetical protein
MVEPQDSRVARYHGLNDSSLWLFGLLLSRPSEVWWFDDSRRNVRSSGVLWCVSFPILHRAKAKMDFIAGSVYGAFQGYARAFYAELLPPGEEARWYGLFSITDKVRISNPLRNSRTVITSPSNNRTVKFLYRPSPGRLNFRCDWEYSLCFLLSRVYDLAGYPHPDERGC